MLYLYGDIMSQPTRAVWTLAMENQDLIGPFKIVEVNLSSLDQYKPEFKKINPIGKVPAMKDEQAGK